MQILRQGGQLSNTQTAHSSVKREGNDNVWKKNTFRLQMSTIFDSAGHSLFVLDELTDGQRDTR
jgi:hypothetical protein